MSHNVENISGATPSVNTEITKTLSYNSQLGHALNNTDSSDTGSGSGNYANGNYYLFFTGADSYSGLATLTSDSITIPDGTYFIRCVPTFGQQTSTSANTEIFMQFHDQNDSAVGNKMSITLDNINPTYSTSCACVAYVEGPNVVKLKVIGTPTGTFPKNGTESSLSPFFLEIIRIK